jgi:Tfp pilus assembly protein PilF
MFAFVLRSMPKHHPSLSSFPAQRSGGEQALAHAAFALQMQDFGEAERTAASVLKAQRTSVDAVKLLGHALLAQNRPDEAVAPLEKAARRSRDPAVETLLAVALAATGQRGRALEQLRRTTARRPPFAPAFREHAGQLARAGQPCEAIALLESGLKLMPDIVELQLDLARLQLAGNDRTKARATLTKALAAAPGRLDLLTVLARVMYLDGEYASAADAYRHAVALRPDDGMAQIDLGTCLLEMGEREAAEKSLRLAVHSNPQTLGRAIHTLSAASHGRFFLQPSAVAKFLHH